MHIVAVLTALRVIFPRPSCSGWKLKLRLCSVGLREEGATTQPLLSSAFLAEVFLGHVFFDTSPSNWCVSAHETRYCADQTWHVLWVWLDWAWGEARQRDHIIPSSGWPAVLPCWTTAAPNPLFPCPGMTCQPALHVQQHLLSCSQLCCKDAWTSAKVSEVDGVKIRETVFSVNTLKTS